MALNQFIDVAVAEKVSALQTEEYLGERGAKGDVAKAKRLLKRAGRGNPATNWTESQVVEKATCASKSNSPPNNERPRLSR